MPQPNQPERNGILPPKQERLACAIAIGMSVAAARRKCNVPHTTAWMWMRQPAFRERIIELQQAMTGRAIGRLSRMMGSKVVNAICELLDSDNEEMKEAGIICARETFLSMRNSINLEARIEEMERSQKGKRR